jgi:hypothetical protein
LKGVLGKAFGTAVGMWTSPNKGFCTPVLYRILAVHSLPPMMIETERLPVNTISGVMV